ncbi:DEAD/DEAH box helicase [Arcticibacter eurypsychrophilus]|uniref:DEAD/DEAH box helicase n=1 Tax=Arcticibacter eurypsychrophilus TaxID=1434752 RepID=UPI000AC40395|nr:DEAD/DEAH box helicase [Arcticibacter eurypsychrophilus]
MTFNDFNFEEPLLDGILSMGYKEPTPIQQQTIPLILEGKDLIACAQTGTGKTASYLLPVLNSISKTDKKFTHTLILAPTRELAQQIDQQVEGLGYFTGISSVAVYGGGDGIVYGQQQRALKDGVDIIIATPGRLIAHLNAGTFKAEHLKCLILDEADRMMDMGFLDDIMRIISFLPAQRQTVMFSATMPPKIRKLATSILNHPEQVTMAVSTPAAGIDQQIYKVTDSQKIPLITLLLQKNEYSSVLIFASTKDKVKALYKSLKAIKIQAKAFHSDLDQSEREEIMLLFRNRKLRVLIGTDVLSRGIDVEGISLVLNFDAPIDAEDYIHRVGRTARAETTGTAITFVNEKDQRKLLNIEALIGRPIPHIALPVEIGEEPVFKTSTGSTPFKRKKKFVKR